MRRPAFSLIEMSLALLVLAIAAAAVTLRWNGPTQQARIGDVVGQIEQFDRRTRQLARQQGRPLQVVVEIGGRRVARFSESGREQAGSVVDLPDGFAVGELKQAAGSLAAGPTSVGYSSQGFAATYAIRIDGPGGQRRWLLFAGLSGQMTEPKDETEVEAIFAALR